MNGKERITRTLLGQPIDHIGVFEEFWTDTATRWISEGYVKENPPYPLLDHFGWDIEKPWPFDFTANVHAKNHIIKETEDVVTFMDGNGAILRKHKKHISTPEHVSFTCTDRETWEDKIKPYFMEIPVGERIDIRNGYLPFKERAEKNDAYMLLGSWHVFQDLVNITGHENLLFGMADDPEWVDDMIRTIADLSIALHEELFSMVGKPDALYLMEDLGYKGTPFFSAAMFRRFYKPVYKEFADFAHSNGLKLFFHSCGFIEPLLPDLVETGIDCLTAMEHKAGMDVKRIATNFGDKIALLGGLDMVVLESNDLNRIDAMLDEYIPFLKNYRYILASDHSTSPKVDYPTFTHFIQRGLELGTYKQYR